MTKEQLSQELEKMRLQLQRLDSCRQEVQSVQRKYDRLLQSTPDAMLFVDGDARIVLVNQQLEKLFGYTGEELVGQGLHILIPERFRGRHQSNVANYFSNPRARPMGTGLQIYGLKKDGTEFPADIALSPLEADGELLAIAAIRDITERKRAERGSGGGAKAPFGAGGDTHRHVRLGHPGRCDPLDAGDGGSLWLAARRLRQDLRGLGKLDTSR